MSDTSQGEGWWQASDGKWYRPEQLPAPPVVPSPASDGIGTAFESESGTDESGGATDGGELKPVKVEPKPTDTKDAVIGFVIIGVVVAGVVLLLVWLFSGGNTSPTSASKTTTQIATQPPVTSSTVVTTTTTAPPASTTTTAPPATTTTTAPPPPPPPTTTPGQNTAAMAPPGIAGPVPNVVGANLSAAEAALLGANLGYQTESSSTFGVIVASGWTVCSQNPSAGTVATSVNLIVARTC